MDELIKSFLIEFKVSKIEWRVMMGRSGEPCSEPNPLVKDVESRLREFNVAGEGFVELLGQPGTYKGIGDVDWPPADGKRARAHVQRGNLVEIVFIYSEDGKVRVTKSFPRCLGEALLEQVRANVY